MRQMQVALDSYQDDLGDLPENLNGLVAAPPGAEGKWDGPYLPKGSKFRDSWGNKYQYKRTPGAERPYELFSYGSRDGKKTPKAEWVKAK